MKAIILGVGTELTTGQIVNKNAAWLSNQLKNFGVSTTAHLVVPDDKKIILDALIYCGSVADLIFVTGGLGPTSDDFTRDLIAEWTKTELIFDETSFTHVKERLASRGYLFKDEQHQKMQRQQCYFPKGATILQNAQGTANGFMVSSQQPSGLKNIFVLPGPPREVEAIWNDAVQVWLQKNTSHLDKIITKAWDTLGVGESNVAVLVEDALKEKKSSLPIEVGYRVHLPYVEVKLSYPQSTAFTSEVFVQKVEKALENITVIRDLEDIADLFARETCEHDFAFYDFASEGFLHHRLSPYLRKYKNWAWKEASEAMDSDFFTDEQNFLALLPSGADRCVILGDWKGRKLHIEVEAPMKAPTMTERRKQYFAEMALVRFYNTLC